MRHSSPTQDVYADKLDRGAEKATDLRVLNTPGSATQGEGEIKRAKTRRSGINSGGANLKATLQPVQF